MMQWIGFAGEELQYGAHRVKYAVQRGRKGQQQKILVNGSPKTGTTWMIKLLTSIPGYSPAGNFKGKIHNYRHLQPGDVVHGHDSYSAELGQILGESGVKVVLTLRDPRDQVVSRVFHLRRDEDYSGREEFLQLSDDEALMACIEGRPGVRSVLDLTNLTKSWLDSGFATACVRYEDLKATPEKELSMVIRSLEIDAGPGFQKCIIKRNRFERLTVGKRFWQTARKAGQENPHSHFRKGIVGDWRNYFKPDHIRRFKEIAGDTLIEWGYEKDLTW